MSTSSSTESSSTNTTVMNTPSSITTMYLSDMNKCRDIWKNFELDRKRDLFDSQGINISKSREQSAANRKNLAQITKDFKKLSNEEKVSSFQKVLKAYQEEIDSLTNRSMSAEKLFLDLYQPLREAPDPYYIICKYQQLFQQNQQQNNQEEYEKTISELKNQLNDYENEFMHLKNQEVTIRKLEEEALKYKNQSELLKEHDFIIQKHKDREIIILNELKEIKAENERLNNLYIDTQNLNYELKTRLEEIEASRQYQVDLHQEQVLQLENQILELKSQTKAATEHLDGSLDEQIVINEMKTEYLKKISELKEDVKEKNHKIQQLHQQLQQQQQIILNIQNEMTQRPTREALQKLQERINTLQQLEFGYDSNTQEKSVEQLLKEKVIKLENDLTKSNQNNRDKDEKIESLNTQLNELSVKASEQLRTIEKLEASVDQLTKSSTLPSNTEEVNTSLEPQSLISILTEQRNRFRDKFNTLEEENLKLKQHIEHLENEQSKLRKENLKLYEKTKYLQSYNQNAHTSTNRSASSSQDFEPIQNKYEQLYEQELDPFKRFHRKEREERLNNMTAAEKVIYRCSSLMLSHKLGRMFLFFYLLALHTLVFFTLSKLSGLSIRRK
ncbi:hypothetical protein C9374_012787 [Naegleria lovaniensis]|uniref:Protein CASP n=1 Tax=Naegleria lovaniensis TaxID=51637 RepID=A0AA88G753_NAELO|nr:uncharacterized protein C9374_012787 [Naegleria lovaniensis]KAG2373185.1 hypothetical protein C9374_012787 [Naegleria lovaniensis]